MKNKQQKEEVLKEFREIESNDSEEVWTTHEKVEWLDKALDTIYQQGMADGEEALQEVLRDLKARREHESFEGCYVCDETLYHLSSLTSRNNNQGE